MVKLPTGSATQHMLKSTGADTDIMKFYCTQNATTYGQKFNKFQPRPGKHTGTGYVSNFRPGVYYTPNLDLLDNPVMGDICARNYKSITIRDYVPYDTPDGREPLPNSCYPNGSGFVRVKPMTVPTELEVRQVAIDTRTASAPVNVMSKYKPYLDKIKPKDPVEQENGGYGPGYMTTETAEKFGGRQPDRTCRQPGGGKEESGFTHNQNIEPLQFHPNHAYLNDGPGWLTSRPTGLTITKTHFPLSRYANGAEPLPRIAYGSERGTGFSSGTKAKPEYGARQPGDAYDKATNMPAAKLAHTRKNDPAELQNMEHPNNGPSVTKLTFLGQQRPAASEADRLGRTDVGFKEETGFTENNDRFVQTSDNPARFITHYMTRFVDRTEQGLEKGGHIWGGVLPPETDGYTKSTLFHKLGTPIDTTASLRGMEPYVGRSLRARDQYFDDHTYDSKMSTARNTMAVY